VELAPNGSAEPRVSVVIPALNEARNLPYVFARMPSDVYEVILVDGNSVDGTPEVARQLWPDIRIVRQTRSGKGNALACGFANVTGDIIAMIDADGSADPAEIPRFVNALLDGAEFAKGTRYALGGRSDDITFLRSLGNRVLTTIFNICYRRRYSDLCYGFNVFWRRHCPRLGLDAAVAANTEVGQLWGDGFEIETLIHIRVAKARLRVTEVPSHEHARIHGVSNLRAVPDGLRVLSTILTERRHSREHRRALELVPARSLDSPDTRSAVPGPVLARRDLTGPVGLSPPRSSSLAMVACRGVSARGRMPHSQLAQRGVLEGNRRSATQSRA
jgi:glycosyltransferase involved in cell wall biosynthesis